MNDCHIEAALIVTNESPTNVSYALHLPPQLYTLRSVSQGTTLTQTERSVFFFSIRLKTAYTSCVSQIYCTREPHPTHVEASLHPTSHAHRQPDCSGLVFENKIHIEMTGLLFALQTVCPWTLYNPARGQCQSLAYLRDLLGTLIAADILSTPSYEAEYTQITTSHLATAMAACSMLCLARVTDHHEPIT